MDALDILTDLDNVHPYFQPIFSADEHRVIGYEVLGRYKSQDGVESLGPFFLDESIPEEYRLEVDNIVLTKALDQALGLEDDVLLFVNRDANLLMHENGELLLKLLLGYEEKGIKLNRIVLEITEQNFNEDLNHLDNLLNYYRTYGMKIAIDKVGNDSSHFERIGQLAPDIMKIDLLALRSTETATRFQDVLYSLSILARKIGASLLFENIEMVYQLQFAWKNGGRFYQGYYLHKPAESFINRNLLKDKLKKECHQFISYEKNKLEKLHSITDSFHRKMSDFIQKNRIEDYEGMLKELAIEIQHMAFRLYVCDEDGFQKSPNIIKFEQEWTVQPEYMSKNWSWRPYFLENIVRMRKEKRGLLSDLYSDIETGESIRTFSFPLNSGDFLFVDLAYAYLYENADLL
ncbi:EAL domain-containing protein [Cytobacillus spongiae]|uniref:EAL domain-containing protein n=1 Tax=Cytobacillus spongiae TaxID=2901381 RepID=UPI001F385D3B|nr:EAL-associated domain-containing protein [Cytobacillus spongiae]UII57223.1 EAL domain-containing protein [Cytobacillus spongiae]